MKSHTENIAMEDDEPISHRLRKRKRRDDAAPAVNPRKGNVVQYRASGEPEQTSALVDKNAAPFFTPRKMVKARQKFKAIRSFKTPIAITKRSEQGSPLEVKVSDGQLLSRVSQNGVMSFFAGKKVQSTPIQTIAPENITRLTLSSPFKAVKKGKKIKYQDVNVTSEMLDEAGQITRRCQSQNKTMANEGVSEKKASANNYAHATEAFPEELMFEWLHFIAHRFLGNKSQHDENMGCGTFNCNTEMIFLEYQIPELCEQYPDGVRLRVVGIFEEGTQILKKLHYTVITDDYELPFLFDARQTVRPNISHLAYMKGFFESFKNEVSEGASASPETMRKAMAMVYSKDEVCKKIDFSEEEAEQGKSKRSKF